MQPLPGTIPGEPFCVYALERDRGGCWGEAESTIAALRSISFARPIGRPSILCAQPRSPPARCQDLTQGFFAHLIEARFMRADRTKGKVSGFSSRFTEELPRSRL
jgi:hypothetical protein